jgi:hypothetical protein
VMSRRTPRRTAGAQRRRKFRAAPHDGIGRQRPVCACEHMHVHCVWVCGDARAGVCTRACVAVRVCVRPECACVRCASEGVATPGRQQSRVSCGREHQACLPRRGSQPP